MTPYETITNALDAIGKEFNKTLELDEDGFLTLEWRGRRVTVVAWHDGDAYGMLCPLFALPTDTSPTAVVYELLRRNLPGNLRPGNALAAFDDTVFLVRQDPAAPVDAALLKDNLLAFTGDAEELDIELRQFIRDLPAEHNETAPPAGAPADRARLDSKLSPEELLRANMKQNLRF